MVSLDTPSSLMMLGCWSCFRSWASSRKAAELTASFFWILMAMSRELCQRAGRIMVIQCLHCHHRINKLSEKKINYGTRIGKYIKLSTGNKQELLQRFRTRIFFSNLTFDNKQEAHGPHRSPDKQFKSINTYDYIITLIKKRKKHIIDFRRINWFFI